MDIICEYCPFVVHTFKHFASFYYCNFVTKYHSPKNWKKNPEMLEKTTNITYSTMISWWYIADVTLLSIIYVYIFFIYSYILLQKSYTMHFCAACSFDLAIFSQVKVYFFYHLIHCNLMHQIPVIGHVKISSYFSILSNITLNIFKYRENYFKHISQYFLPKIYFPIWSIILPEILDSNYLKF